MNLANIVAELASRLNDIDDLRVYPYPPDSISDPAGVFPVPDDIMYDVTYGRGMDRITLPLLLLIGKASDRTIFTRISPYVSGSGASSVKAVLESGTYTALHTVVVKRCQFDVITWAQTDYLAAIFTLDIAGAGA